jgi:hypothetical protein
MRFSLWGTELETYRLGCDFSPTGRIDRGALSVLSNRNSLNADPRRLRRCTNSREVALPNMCFSGRSTSPVTAFTRTLPTPLSGLTSPFNFPGTLPTFDLE